MKKSYLSFSIPLIVLAMPLPIFAAVCTSFYGTPNTFGDVICLFIDLALTAIPVVAGLALVVFFWGLARFILHANSEEGREQGKQVMLWGIIALFVLVSIWGIILFLNGEFGFQGFGVPQLPV